MSETNVDGGLAHDGLNLEGAISAVLENVLTQGEQLLVARGARDQVITPGLACELFFLDAPPLAPGAGGAT